jgi:uncharacterized membrane protein YqaE (UPF0057 family)
MTIFCANANAVVSTVNPVNGQKNNEVTTSTSQLNLAQANALLSLTPAKYEELTGKKMGLVSKLALKIAQKKAKAAINAANTAGSSFPKVAYIILAIVGLGFLSVGLASDWNGNDWWITLLLSFLFVLPGVIYALIVMHKYY